MHRGEGVWLRRLQVPPGHPRLHAPGGISAMLPSSFLLTGRRLHPGQWQGGQVHLWNQVHRRELCDEAQQGGVAVHGQLREEHQRQPVLHHSQADPLAGWQACRLRRGDFCSCPSCHRCVFQVVEGYNSVVKKVESLGSGGGATSGQVIIAASGCLHNCGPIYTEE